MTPPSEAALAFDGFLDTDAPAVADVARALRLSLLAVAPEMIEAFDPADRLLAFGVGPKLRDFWFAIIPHKAKRALRRARAKAASRWSPPTLSK